MKKILAALFLGALITCAHAQGLIAPGHVIGNGTSTNPHAATDSSLSSVMDQALCGNNNSVAERVSGVWGCLSITTGVATALGIAPNSAGGIITWPLSLAGAGVSGQLPLTGIASIAADNLLGNFTGSSAPPQAGALTNCPSALTYSTTTHSFGCNSGAAVTGPASSTVGHVAIWNNTAGTNIADGGPLVATPGGRLTLQSHTPVMTTSQTAKTTIYYDSYGVFAGGVPYFNGTIDAIDPIASNEVSLTLQSTGTGVTNANGVFDVWWFHHAGSPVICVATNGTGGGWASDTGGSNTARGTGYSKLDNTTRAYITNASALTHCYNGTTDYGSISANQATYLGTVMTDAAAAGSVSFTLGGAASGGSAAWIGIWNYYNRVSLATMVTDNQTGYTYASATIRSSGNSTNNRVTAVFGAAEDSIKSTFSSSIQGSSTANGEIGLCLDVTNAFSGRAGITGGVNSQYSEVSSFFNSLPLAGQHFIQACESAPAAASVTFNLTLTNSFQTLLVDWKY